MHNKKKSQIFQRHSFCRHLIGDASNKLMWSFVEIYWQIYLSITEKKSHASMTKLNQMNSNDELFW